jgi:hypothetical protein
MKWIALAATIVLAGCAHGGDARSRSEQASAPDAIYGMPSGGTVRFAVLGLREVPATKLGQNGFRALVVRMTLDNDGGTEPWRVTPSEQVAHIQSYGAMLPANAPNQPLTVAPGEVVPLELLYPVPKPDYGPELPQRIAVDWRLRMPTAEIRERAVLDRQLARAMRQHL